jgi:hypothetical protein
MYHGMAKNILDQRREYYAKNKERIKAKSALYYLENKTRINSLWRKKYKENPEPKKSYAKKYSMENPLKGKVYSKTWVEKHPEKRKLYTRNSRIRKYGISPETYYEMLEKQGHKCDICKAKSIRRAMNIDHNHTTGKVRGLLCDKCNLMLGIVEKKDFLDKALKYLAKYK